MLLGLCCISVGLLCLRRIEKLFMNYIQDSAIFVEIFFRGREQFVNNYKNYNTNI